MLASVLKQLRVFLVFIISCFILYSSMMKLVGYPGMEESFALWGYGKSFMLFIGIVEIILAIGVFVPKTRVVSLLGLIGLMTGAIYTHVTNYEEHEVGSAIFVMTTCLIILGLIYFESRNVTKQS